MNVNEQQEKDAKKIIKHPGGPMSDSEIVNNHWVVISFPKQGGLLTNDLQVEDFFGTEEIAKTCIYTILKRAFPSKSFYVCRLELVGA